MNKYGARKTEVDGHIFDSKAEANRYLQLKLLERAGEIRHLEIQPKYMLDVKNTHICNYIGDFRYTDCLTGKLVIEDVKGMKTPVYKLKKKLMKALFEIDILETGENQ